MPRYDSIGTAAQLGDDLSLWTSGTVVPFRRGDPEPGSSAHYTLHHWDTMPSTESSFAETQEVRSLVDMCVHDGKLHVVWVEQKEVAGVQYAAGPYVKRWDGSSWTQLGGVLDDDPYAEQGVMSTVVEPGYIPVGARTYPGRPKIVSDGDDLYVAYTIHVGKFAIDPPAVMPTPVHFPGDPYRVNNTDHQYMWARDAYVRRWTGTDWEVYGIVEARTNNSFTGIYGGAYTLGPTHGDDRFCEIRLVSDPDEPGVLYVSFVETGLEGTSAYYILNPHYFVGFTFGQDYYPLWHGLLSVTRFDGSDTVGVAKDVFRISSVSHYAAPGDIYGIGPLGPAVGYARYRGAWKRHELFVEDGECWIIVSATQFNEATNEDMLRAYRWSDTPAITTLGPVNFEYAEQAELPVFATWIEQYQQPNSNPTRSALYERHYLLTPARALEFTDDFDYLDQDSVVAGRNLNAVPSMPITLQTSLLAEDDDNVWATSMNTFVNQATGHVFLYHRTCQAWTAYGVRVPPDEPSRPLGDLSLARIGNNLYVAGAYFNKTTKDDLRIRVLRIPIMRNASSCGVDIERVAINARVSLFD